MSIGACAAAGPCTNHAVIYSFCNSTNDFVLGGGWSFTDTGGPSSDGGTVQAGQSHPATSGGTQYWFMDLNSVQGVTHINITGYAICMAP